jgi:hypothetical protein
LQVPAEVYWRPKVYSRVSGWAFSRGFSH